MLTKYDHSGDSCLLSTSDDTLLYMHGLLILVTPFGVDTLNTSTSLFKDTELKVQPG